MDRQYCGVYHHHVVGVDVYLLDDGETNMNEDEKPTTTENNGGKTGWPPGLLQDDSKGLSKWFSNKPDAKRRVREALAEQPAQQEPRIDIYRSFEQWKNGNVLEHGVPRTEYYSEQELSLVEMGWKYGYDAGRAVEQALDKKAEAKLKEKK